MNFRAQIIILAFFIFFYLGNATALGALSPTSEMDSIKNALMEQRYHCAELSVKKLISENPGNIEAIYLGSAIRQTAILDYESYTIDADGSVASAENAFAGLSKKLREQRGKDSIDCLFYMGSILGGIGVIKAKNGNWPGAIKNALASVKYYKRILSLDSTYFAAYFGVGAFNYYLSQQLKWLPFFGDRRIEAIEQLQKAARAPFPFNYVARNSLCWIYIERNEFARADSVASFVLSRYPDNTLFIRIKIRIDLAKKRWNQALAGAEKLLSLSLKRNPPNWADIVSGYQAMVCGYDRLNRGGESLKAANSVLSLPIPDEFRRIPFVKRHLKYITEIREKYTDRIPVRPAPARAVNKRSSLMSQAAWHFADARDF